MGVDAGVAGGAREILVLPIGNVLVGARISELFGQSKIYHITQVALVLKEVYQLCKSGKKVISSIPSSLGPLGSYQVSYRDE